MRKNVTNFTLMFVVPTFLIGVGIGSIGGFVAQWLAQIFELYENESKYEMVFWAFVIIGAVMGGAGGIQALFQFVRQKKNGGRK
ncbi:hypothetical protein [Marinobacter nauticus]|jgi:uncharacterized membrane protein YeaQ/YmgE (transglycosylase-associated protein family)|uniref:hypothetical protein n=1 Tax=Marinobacter nauticus TaxID=2743 RepID=UPI000DF1BE03|nr:hypothetical protein [Marinobacter nauticus]|tara:strand:- start:676 stop:927 length:252 start_codon:yes stop_codon:yes gene_type:complete